jgi:hypothetical protein
MMNSNAPARYCRCGTRLARDNPDSLCALCQKRMRDIARCPPEVPAEFWETDQMRDALESRHMGRVCFAYRHHRFHDLGPLSQELVGGWFGISQAQVSRIENGPPIQDLDKLIYWAQTLRIPPYYLWFDLPGSRRHAVQASSSDTDRHSVTPPLRMPPSVGIPVVSLSAHGRAVQGVKADAAALGGFRVADRQVGGGHMHAAVVQYLQVEVGPRLFGNGSAESSREVFCAAAGLTEMAGWTAHDAGQDGLAEQHFVRARDLSKLGDDPELSAHIFASLSHLANHLGRPTEAITLARAGQAKVRRGPRNPELDARLYAMEARGYAGWHKSIECARTLVKAKTSLEAGPARGSSEWVSGFDEGSLAMEAGRCMQQLGQLGKARGEAERVVALRGGDRTRSRAFGQLMLAALLVMEERLDEARALGYEVLAGTQALGSFRVIQELQTLEQLLEPYRSVRVVADFLAYATETRQERMWLYHWLGPAAVSTLPTPGET